MALSRLWTFHAKRISYHQQLSLGRLCINLTFFASPQSANGKHSRESQAEIARCLEENFPVGLDDNASVKVLFLFSGQGEADACCWGWQESDKIIVRIAQEKFFIWEPFRSRKTKKIPSSKVFFFFFVFRNASWNLMFRFMAEFQLWCFLIIICNDF